MRIGRGDLFREGYRGLTPAEALLTAYRPALHDGAFPLYVGRVKGGASRVLVRAVGGSLSVAMLGFCLPVFIAGGLLPEGQHPSWPAALWLCAASWVVFELAALWLTLRAATKCFVDTVPLRFLVDDLFLRRGIGGELDDDEVETFDLAAIDEALYRKAVEVGRQAEADAAKAAYVRWALMAGP